MGNNGNRGTYEKIDYREKYWKSNWENGGKMKIKKRKDNTIETIVSLMRKFSFSFNNFYLFQFYFTEKFLIGDKM
jgi:hypothetical protein